MSITIQCQCSRVITVSAQLAGQTTRCPSCGRRHLIPTNLPEPLPVALADEPAPEFDGECAECGEALLRDAAYCHGCGLPRDESPVEPSPEPSPEPARHAQRVMPPVSPLRIPAAEISAAPAAPPIVSAQPRETASPFHAASATDTDRAASSTVPGPDGPFAHGRCRATRTRGQAVAAASAPYRDGCCGPFRAERAEANGAMRPNGFGRVGMTFAVMAMIAGTFMLVFACPVLKKLGNDRNDLMQSEAIRFSSQKAADHKRVQAGAIASEEASDEQVANDDVVRVDDESATVETTGDLRYSTKPAHDTGTTVSTRADKPAHKCGGFCPLTGNDEAIATDGGQANGEQANGEQGNSRCRIGKLTGAQAVNLCYGLGVLSLGFAVLGALCGFMGALQWRRPKGQAVWAVILCATVFVMVSPAMDRVADVRADMSAPSVSADDDQSQADCAIKLQFTCGQSCAESCDLGCDDVQTEGEAVRDQTILPLVDPSLADETGDDASANTGTVETEPRD